MTHGGKRDGAGRKPGSGNKASMALKEHARQYGPAIIDALAELAGLVGDKPAASEQVRVAAMNILLDRGFGKAPQAITGENGEGPVLLDILSLIDGKTRGIPNVNPHLDAGSTTRFHA